jgi:hypothetical protein
VVSFTMPKTSSSERLVADISSGAVKAIGGDEVTKITTKVVSMREEKQDGKGKEVACCMFRDATLYDVTCGVAFLDPCCVSCVFACFLLHVAPCVKLHVAPGT